MRRSRLAAVVLTAALAAGGLTAAGLLAPASGTGSGGTAATTASGGQSGTTGVALEAAGMPEMIAPPHTATILRVPHTSRHSGSVTSSAEASNPALPGAAPATGPGTGQASYAAPQSAPTMASSGSASCMTPQYTTSDPTGMWNLAPYFVANDMWGISGYNVAQTLYACSYANWYVVATMDNSSGDGAVKTYPNSHRDFDSEPAISSFNSVTSTFAETSPGTGSYEDAYDIWLNGIGSSGSTEVMIWTDNHGQTPAGSVQGTATIGGQSYTVWKTAGSYIAFVANSNFTSGDMNLLAFFQWIMSKGWLAHSATLGQVGFGVELVSTNGVPATFTFSNFSVNAS